MDFLNITQRNILTYNVALCILREVTYSSEVAGSCETCKINKQTFE
jgi:hypothetical protein